MSEKLKVAAQNLESQQTKNADTIASSALQAEMMYSLGEELKGLEQVSLLGSTRQDPVARAVIGRF